MEKLNKETARNLIEGIYNILQTIPVNGEQNTSNMSGVFRALKDLVQWINEVSEAGDKEDVK